MMVAVDDDDDFIVKPPSENGEASGTSSGIQHGVAPRSLLAGIKRLVFAKGDADGGAAPAEPEPILPAGFSAILNAEEEDIYPADVKIRVLLAEGNLGGRARRQAAELHQALQQVVGTTAIYSHLIRKHKSGNIARRRRSASDVDSERERIAASTGCGCGGESGPCKAISKLLREELAKITDAAEAERRGARLKRLREAERRSGGLCNPAQLEREATSSSSNPPEVLTEVSSTAPVAPVIDSPRRGVSSWSGQMAALASAAVAAGAPVAVTANGALGSNASSGRSSASGSDGGGSPVGILKRQASDMPWADNMLSASNRTRYGAMLRTRGRDLTKRMSTIVPAAAAELQTVGARLPPWEDEPEGDLAAPVQQLSLHGNNKGHHQNNHTNVSSNGSSHDSSTPQNRSSSVSDPHPVASSLCVDTSLTARAKAQPNTGQGSLTSERFSSSPPARSRAATAPPENDPRFARPKAIFGSNQGVTGNGRSGPSQGSGGEFVVVDARKKQQDWKLNAQELSMINKEEERVMPPEVLGRLLAAGAAIPSSGQRNFWDIFSRLEIATRTEALLNIAIRGGKGCPARAGRMGRELCMSLTSVVLDAIAAVQQEQQLRAQHATTGAPHHHQQPPHQQQHHTQQQRQQQLSSKFATTDAQQRQQVHEQQQEQQQRRQHQQRERQRQTQQQQCEGEMQRQKEQNRKTAHLSLKKMDRRLLQQELNKARNCRSGELEPLNPHRSPEKNEPDARLRPRAGVPPQRPGATGRRRGSREDPGLSDLDEREGEFRQAIYVVRSSLAGRLLQMTRDAPLCAEVLGSFVNNVDPPTAAAEHPPQESSSHQTSPDNISHLSAGDTSHVDQGHECRVSQPLAESDHPKGGESRSLLAGGDSMSRRSSGFGSSGGDDTLLFECNGSGAGSCTSQPSPSGSCGSHVSPPLSMASTAPASDGGDEPPTSTGSSNGNAAKDNGSAWDQCPMDGTRLPVR